MSDILQPDLCILGGGAGGSTLAAGAAACGLSIVLVEQGRIGGDALAHAVPGHALLAAGHAAAAMRRAERFGIDAPPPQIDFARVRAHIAEVAAALAQNYSQGRLEAMNVKVINAPGRFTGPDQLEADGLTVKARRFVVATGAPAQSLPIPGLNLIRPLSYAGLCGLERPPRRLIVIGADPDGLALAQGMRRLGGEVVVLAPAKLFTLVDDELVAPVRAQFARDGVIVHEWVRVLRVEPHGEGLRAFIARAGRETKTATETIEGSHLLIAAGGAPLVEGLGLAAAGVRFDAAGIDVGSDLRTSNRRVYAIGAVVRGGESRGATEYQAGLVLGHLLRGEPRLSLGGLLGFPAGRMQPKAIVRLISTDPEIAITGLSETEAREVRHHVLVLRWPFAETDRAQIERATAGHVKLVTTRGGAILGAGIVGPAAGELINLYTLAISKGMTAADVASIMAPYPTRADALRRAGGAFWRRRRGNLAARYFPRLWRWLG